jgi:ABC-type multidrug transport system ATPase subunit
MTPTTSPLLSSQNLSKRFGPRWLFRDLSFELHTGECLIIQGRNGSGKSTLLRLLAGLDRPSDGTVQLGFDDYRTELSLCALEQATFPNLTVLEHLEIAATMRGMQEWTPESSIELIHKVGLQDHTKHASQHLSSGLRSRLKIALAIQPRPKILIWDEPGVALDDSGRLLIESVVKEQKERGALVIATNDASETRFGTHLLNLDEGSI